jgi:hypothetical protein
VWINELYIYNILRKKRFGARENIILPPSAKNANSQQGNKQRPFDLCKTRHIHQMHRGSSLIGLLRSFFRQTDRADLPDLRTAPL